MRRFEWPSKPKSRDPLGTVEVGGRCHGNRSPIRVLVCFALVVLLLGFWIFLVRGVWDVWGLAGGAVSVVATVIYLLLGYVIHPKPDTSNLGFWPFPAPFRPLAKFNVLLVYMKVVLWPGRFVFESLVDMVRLVVYALQPRPNGTKVRGPESN